MLSHRQRHLATLLAILTLVLAACGGAAPTATSATAAPAGSAAAATATPDRTIVHAVGTTTVKGTPTRVVVLEWSYTEHVLDLGVTPVGVTDIPGYKKFHNIQTELVEKVTDVGTRAQPSLEAISKLNPDLIVAVESRHKAIYDKLSAIAPTIMYNSYPTTAVPEQLTEMYRIFTSIANALNKQTQAEAVIKKTNEVFAAQAARIAAKKPATDQFVLVTGSTVTQVPTWRAFIDTGLATQVLLKVGLKNAYKGTFDANGYNVVGTEALTPYGGANLFFAVQDDDNIVNGALRDNAVWKSLGFVKENRTFALGATPQLFFGPVGAQILAQRVADALTK